MEAINNNTNTLDNKDNNSSQDNIKPVATDTTDTNLQASDKATSSNTDSQKNRTVETDELDSDEGNEGNTKTTTHCSGQEKSKSDANYDQKENSECQDSEDKTVCEKQPSVKDENASREDNDKSRINSGDALAYDKSCDNAKDKSAIDDTKTCSMANSKGLEAKTSINEAGDCKLDGEVNKKSSETEKDNEDCEETKKKEKQGRNLALFAAATKERSVTPDKLEMDTLGEPYNVVRKVSFTLGEGTISLAEHEFLMEKRRKSEANLSDEKYKPPNQFRYICSHVMRRGIFSDFSNS